MKYINAILKNNTIRLVLLTFLLPTISAGQKYPDIPADSFFNISDSPVILTIRVDGAVNILNKSDKEIFSVKFGCIKIDSNEQIHLIKECSTKELHLSEHGEYLEQNSHSPVLNPIKLCPNEGTKLAIIEVYFFDDSKWGIKQTNQSFNK